MANENINTEVVETTEPTKKGGFLNTLKKIVKHPVTKVVGGFIAGVAVAKGVDMIMSKSKESTNECDSEDYNTGCDDETIG
jgi:hypothetical protein